MKIWNLTLILLLLCAQNLSSNRIDDIEANVKILNAEMKEVRENAAQLNVLLYILSVALGAGKQENIEAETSKISPEVEIKPKNQWSDRKSKNFFILKPDCLTAVCLDSKNELYAKYKLVQHFDFIYYEVNIIKEQKSYANATTDIGFCTKLGSCHSYYYYNSNGLIYGHNLEDFGGFPEFGEGDIVGCGVNTTSMEIIYTKNGKLLNTTGILVSSKVLLPKVRMRTQGDIIKANFGPNFAYKFNTNEP